MTSTLNLYLVSLPSRPISYMQTYDFYDSFVVCCETEQQARQTHPLGLGYVYDSSGFWTSTGTMIGDALAKHNSWVKGVDIHLLDVKHIGTAIEETPEIILASYNAG